MLSSMREVQAFMREVEELGDLHSQQTFRRSVPPSRVPNVAPSRSPTTRAPAARPPGAASRPQAAKAGAREGWRSRGLLEGRARQEGRNTGPRLQLINSGSGAQVHSNILRLLNTIYSAKESGSEFYPDRDYKPMLRLKMLPLFTASAV